MARTLKDLLSRQVLKKLRKSAVVIEAVTEMWESAVPERFRGHSKAVGYRKRVLDVAVDSQAVLAELRSFHGQEIDARLKEQFAERGMAPPVRIRYAVEKSSR
ncbi:MAG TPA: DUF721 domain-containing protein [Planctomycetes bacterium]|nr:DUF721 domain-containing protein [Planctomycetota bacterium]